MPVSTRRRYTEEFKREAVRLMRESAYPVAQAAQDLGDSGERAVSLARSAPAGRDPRHDTCHSTHRGRGTHACEARFGAGAPGTGFFKTRGGVLREGVLMRYHAIRSTTVDFPFGSCAEPSRYRPLATMLGEHGLRVCVRRPTGYSLSD